MTLNIGCMMPDRALDECALVRAVTKVAIDLAGQRKQATQNKVPIIDILFLLPSHQEKADFIGLRLRSFNSAEQILRIESAVPEKMLESVHAENYVFAILMDAIDAAGLFFTEESILFDVPGHLALVDFIVQKNTMH